MNHIIFQFWYFRGIEDVLFSTWDYERHPGWPQIFMTWLAGASMFLCVMATIIPPLFPMEMMSIISSYAGSSSVYVFFEPPWNFYVESTVVYVFPELGVWYSILHEAHDFKYSIHSGMTKMY